MWTVKEDMN